MFYQNLLTHFAACGGGSFLGFPTWYKYLPSTTVTGICTPQFTRLSDVWLIVAAVIEILLRIAALAAVGYVMYGGFVFVTSQGEPNRAARGRQVLINALAGLIIAVMAAAVVGFIAGRVS